MNKKTCPSRNELTGYANGTLTPAAADEVTQHIAGCASCEDTLESLSADGLLQQIQAKAPQERYVEEPACRKAVSYVEGQVPAPKGGPSVPAGSTPSSGPAAPARARTMNRNEFVEFVTSSGLLSAAELTATIKGRPDAETADAPALAKTLVQLEKLTKYQAAAIYQGKGSTLFYGDYLVLDRIGAGGMGQVFKARHRRMDRIVALKVMSPAAIKNADSVRRFEREVRAAAKLTHPNVVHAYDAGAQGDVRYLVMEYVEGCDLSALMKQHPKLGIKQTCHFIEQAARGFAAAHAKGIVHRDVKPGNLLIDKTGVVKVLDMGLARFDDEGIGGAMTEGELTQTGSVMGTVDYMAPEQALDTRHADAKSDVYGLGCTLYRALAGEPVFGGRTLVEKILAHRESPVPSIRKLRPDAPPQLDLLLQRMMAKNPADRPTMQEVATALATIDPSAKAGPLEAPIVPTNSGGLPSPTGSGSSPAAASTIGPPQSTPTQQVGGYGVAPSFPAGLPSAGAPQMPRTRTAAAAPPRKRSTLPLLAAAGAGGLLLLAGIWVYIKDKDGRNIAAVEVPEGGSVEMSPTGPTPTGSTPSPTPNLAPNPTPSAATPPTVPPTVPPPAISLGVPASVGVAKGMPRPMGVPLDVEAERRVATRVLDLGGFVNVSEPGGQPRSIRGAAQLPAGPFTVTLVDLSRTKVTDQDLDILPSASQLMTLVLYETGITDAGLEAVTRLPWLRSFSISSNADGRITDAGLKKFEGMTYLQSMRFDNTQITAAAAEALHRKVPQSELRIPNTTYGSTGVLGHIPNTPFVASATSTIATPATSASASTPAGDVVCARLIARRDPVGLSPAAIHFKGPKIDRDGANGFTIKAPADWRTAGTSWTFEYRCNQWDNGIQMIHPVGDGHMRMVLHTGFLGLAPGGPWGIEGIMKYYLPADKKLEPLTSTVYPLNNTDTYRVKSICDAAGNYTLTINDQVIVKRQVQTVGPQQLKPPFEDPKCPDVIAVGDAALIIGPAAAPGAGVTIFNEANDVRLSTAGPTLIAGASPSAVPLDSSVRPVDPAAERAAAVALLASGAKLKFDAGGVKSDLISSATQLPSRPFQVFDVSFYQVKTATDETIAPLRHLRSLEILNLHQTSVTDEGLAVLKDLKKLSSVNISSTPVHGSGIRYLVGLPELKYLAVSDRSIDPSTSQWLAQLKTLEKFDAVRTQLSDLSWVAGTPRLKEINVGGARVSDISALAALPDLKSLNIWRSFIVDSDLVVFRNRKELEVINIVETDVTDAGLSHFEGLPKLKRIDAVDTYITADGAAKLREKNPNLDIRIRTKAGSPPSQRRAPPPLPVETVAVATPVSRATPTAPSRGLPTPSIAFLPSTTPSRTPSATKERKPIPSTSDQTSAQKLVRETFKDEYAAAKTPEQKSTLAAKLIDQARQTLDDPASRYVLLTEARDLAIDGAALEVCNDAINLIIDEFDVDAPTSRLDAWNALLKRPRVDSSTMQQMTRIAGSMFDQATVDGEFDLGKRYGDFALAVTRRIPNSGPAVKTATERNAALAARQKEWPALLAAVEKLKTLPDDAEANLLLARYHALSADNWPTAFPHYAKCGDEALKAAAEKSVAALAGTIQPAAAGDVWWDAAQGLKPPHPQKSEYLAAADYWYRQAAPLLSGISRTRIQKRIDEMEPQLPTRKLVATALPADGTAKPAEAIPGNDRVMPNRTFGDRSKDPPPRTPAPDSATSTTAPSSSGVAAGGPRTAVPQPPLDDQRKIAEYYLALGGTVNAQISATGAIRQVLPGNPLPEENFTVVSMMLSNVKALGDREMAPVQGLRDMKMIFLNGTSITAQGLGYLKGLPIGNINMTGNPQLDDEIVPHLCNLPELSVASLNDVRLSDAGLAKLKDCRRLKALDLAGCKFTGAGFAAFPDDSPLESLNLSNTALDDAGMANLHRFRQLKNLTVSRTSVTDRSLANIAAFERLEGINLEKTQTSDVTLRLLEKMPKLTSIVVGSNTTDAGVQALRQALPMCRVNDLLR